MAEVTGILIGTSPKRGKGPGALTVKGPEGPLELTTFDPAMLRDAASIIGTEIMVTYEEKESKDKTKVYRNALSLKTTSPGALGGAQEASGSTNEALVVPHQPAKAEVVTLAKPAALSAISQLEHSFALAVRQRELLEEFIRSRFKEGEHYMDGATFGSKKRVLLQPGAQLILYCHGYTADFEVISGTMTAPAQDSLYTIVLKCVVRNIDQRVMGTGVGSCSSQIWSGRDNRFKGRGVSPDLTHNSTLKMAKKRALVDACLNTTAAAEYFTQDLDEYPPEEKNRRVFIRG